MLRFAVLGRVEVRDGERLIDPGPARRATVLAALLVDAGRVVPVDVLAERVWDGHPPASAVGTLQAHVSRLRAVLGDAAPLRTTPAGYVLDVPVDAVDALRFAALVGRAEGLVERDERDAARAELAQAFTLWRGRPYDDVVADFVAVEAERLDDLRLSAHELAAELDVEAGRSSVVADRLGPLVVGYPFRERLRAALVVALRRTGRRVEALACLREGRRVLVDELGVEPGERLRALQDEILAEGADEAPRAAPPAEPAVGGDRLIGRLDEVDAVLAACREAAGGATRFVAVRGEAGIGKTRLAEEVSASVAAEGHVVAWGRCWQHEGSPALWPWIEVVRELDGVTPPEVMAEALSGWGAALATVVPELADMIAPGGTEIAEVRVFDAVLHVLGRLCARHPVLVVIDDAQWADPWSRRLLEFLAGHARDLALTVLVTVRSVGVARDDDGLAVLAALARSGRTVAVELSGLGVAEVVALASQRAGRALEDAVGVELHARTDGNPFYVGEITRLVGDGDPGEVGVPDTVRGVIGQRLAGLPTADVDVLAVGAVVGRTFDVELVAAVSGFDEDAVDAAVACGTRAGVLRDEPTDEGDLRFAHALLQETLLDEVGGSRRRRLHRRIAEALAAQRREPTGRRPGADRVAHHYLAAGTDADVRAGVELLLEAVDDAFRQGSVLEVDRLLGEARSAADGIGPGGEPLRQSARARRIAFDAVVHGPTDTESVPEREASELAIDSTDRVDAVDLVTVFYAQWTWPMTRGRMHTALRLSDDLGRLAVEREDDLLRFSAAVMRSSDRTLLGRFEEALAAAVEADGLLARIGEPPAVFAPHPAISSPVWEATNLLVLGHHDEAHRRYATTRPRAREFVGVDSVSAVYLDTFDVYWWTFNDDPDQVGMAAERARRAVERTSVTSMSYFLAMPEAWAHSYRDLDAGAALARAAATYLEGPDSIVYRPMFRGLHADVLLRTGEHADALAALDAGLSESASTGQAVWDAELRRLRARALAALGAPDEDVAVEVARARTVATEQGAVLFAERLDLDHPPS